MIPAHIGTGPADRPSPALRACLRDCRAAFIALFLFSIAINVLVLASPLYMMQVYDRVLASRSMDTLLLLTLIMLFAFLVMAALDWVRARLMVRVSTWLDRCLGGEILAATVDAAGRGDPNRTAQGLRDLASFRGFLTGPGLFPVLDAPWVPFFVGVNFLLHPLLGMLSGAGAVLLLTLAIVNELATRHPIEEAGTAARMAQIQAEMSVRNAEVIQAMGMLPALLARWQQANNLATRLQAASSDRGAIVNAVSKCTRISMQSLSLGLGAYLVIQHEATAGIMIGASIIMGRALAPAEQAIGSWRNLVAARGAFRRIRLLLSASTPQFQRTSLPAPAGHLTLENVHFAPLGSAGFTIRGVSFALRPGEMLGLIGPSAAGKTTLARLMVGAWVPQRGAVRLDDAELAHWDRSALGRNIGYLPQDVELFAGSVRDNIARMEVGSDAMVVEAAKQACLHEMILQLPQGYETEIGAGGAFLSGGQRQRVGLARALYGKPKLLVLDEPDASLDTSGEKTLLATLAALKDQGTTTIVITHRMNLLGLMDKLLVLQAGAMVAFGPRDEVMSRLMRAAPGLRGRARPELEQDDRRDAASGAPIPGLGLIT